MVTLEVVDQEIASLKEQQAGHLALYHQATGAIQALEHIRKLLTERDSMPLQEFAEMVGGPGANGEVVDDPAILEWRPD